MAAVTLHIIKYVVSQCLGSISWDMIHCVWRCHLYLFVFITLWKLRKVIMGSSIKSVSGKKSPGLSAVILPPNSFFSELLACMWLWSVCPEWRHAGFSQCQEWFRMARSSRAEGLWFSFIGWKEIDCFLNNWEIISMLLLWVLLLLWAETVLCFWPKNLRSPASIHETGTE